MRWVRGQRRAIALLGFVMSQSLLTEAAPPTLPKPKNAAEIQLGLQKLHVLGRVLYVAAHPDDENTNLMELWSNGSLYDTTNLTLTHDDSAQNLLAPELQERQGEIRTR